MKKSRFFRPMVESLEERAVPAGSYNVTIVSLPHNQISVTGSPSADATMDFSNGSLSLSSPGDVTASIPLDSTGHVNNFVVSGVRNYHANSGFGPDGNSPFATATAYVSTWTAFLYQQSANQGGTPPPTSTVTGNIGIDLPQWAPTGSSTASTMWNDTVPAPPGAWDIYVYATGPWTVDTNVTHMYSFSCPDCAAAVAGQTIIGANGNDYVNSGLANPAFRSYEFNPSNCPANHQYFLRLEDSWGRFHEFHLWPVQEGPGPVMPVGPLPPPPIVPAGAPQTPAANTTSYPDRLFDISGVTSPSATVTVRENQGGTYTTTSDANGNFAIVNMDYTGAFSNGHGDVYVSASNGNGSSLSVDVIVAIPQFNGSVSCVLAQQGGMMQPWKYTITYTGSWTVDYPVNHSEQYMAPNGLSGSFQTTTDMNGQESDTVTATSMGSDHGDTLTLTLADSWGFMHQLTCVIQ